MPLPSEKEEVWRYSPIDQLDLDDYRPVAPPTDGQIDDQLATAFIDGVAADVPDRAALVVVHNGRPVAIDRGELPESVVVADLATDAGRSRCG